MVQDATYSAGREARNPKDHPFFFGHYLNHARHNAYLIVKYLMEEYGFAGTDKVQEDNLRVLLDKSWKHLEDEPKKYRRFLADLLRHFPFLQPLCCRQRSAPVDKKGNQPKALYEEPDPALVARYLTAAFVRLNQLRNIFSHYKHPLREVKENEVLPLDTLLLNAIEDVERRFWQTLGEEHTAHLRQQADQLFHYRLVQDDHKFTVKGLYFFICLFLPAGEANAFLSQIKGFKDTSTPDKQATRKCFTQYCCQLPRPKLESSDVKLDMLNELVRCPAELWELLGEDDRRQFKVKATPHPDEDIEADEERTVSMKRHKDRFPYFALRFFDEFNEGGQPFFPELCFQIKLARLATTENPANSQRAQPRKYLRDVNAFGKLGDFDKEKAPKSWRNEEGVLLPEIEQFSPGYQDTDNRVAFRFGATQWPRLDVVLNQVAKKGKEQTVKLNERPDGILSTHELPNLFFYQYLHHKGQIAESAEGVIRKYIAYFLRLCDDAQSGQLRPYQPANFRKRTDGYRGRNKAELHERSQWLQEILDEQYGGIEAKHLPDRLRQYLLGYAKTDVFKLAMHKLTVRSEEVKEKLRKVRIHHKSLAADPNLDKKLRPLRAGQLADELAADINFLKPPGPDGKGRAEEEPFRRLQYHLSYFLRDKQEVSAIFQELNLIGDNFDFRVHHPFLQHFEWEKCTGVLHFYQDYFEKKKAWLDDIKYDIHKERISESQLKEEIGHIVELDAAPLKDWDYRSVPVQLPRGLFDREIAAALQRSGMAVGLSDNVVHCLRVFTQMENGNYDFQPYYSTMKRLHLKNEKNERHDGGFGTVEEQFNQYSLAIEQADRDIEEAKNKRLNHKEIFNREKKREGIIAQQRKAQKEERGIFAAKLKDQCMRLMVQELARQQGVHPLLDWHLTNIQVPGPPERKEAELSFQTDSLANIMDREVAMSIHLHGRTIRRNNMRVSEYGKFRKALYDRRLENLLQYFPEGAELDYDGIVAELEGYNKLREDVFENIYTFEKALHDKFGDELLAFHLGRSSDDYIGHETCLSFMGEKFGVHFTQSDQERIKYLRNKFEHNEVPYEPWIVEKVNVEAGQPVLEQLVGLVSGEYERLAEKLEQQAVLSPAAINI